MPLYYNNQEFSDKEVADAIKAKYQERRQWCEQQAREYLAKKERHKYYHCDYYVPEADDNSYLRLPQEILDEVQAAIQKDIEENGPTDKEHATEVYGDIISELNINVVEYLSEPYEYADLKNIHFDDYIYCYRFRVKRFDHEGNEVSDDNLIASLTDDEYIQALTELLYAPHQLSFDGLRRALPEVAVKIMNHVTSPFETSAIFLTEFNDDVDAILKPLGGRDNIPAAGLFDNPFVAFAKYCASKN